MRLEDLGYHQEIEKLRVGFNLSTSELGRVVSEHKERYHVATEKGVCEVEITGNLRFSAKNREDFPAVGDWVALLHYDSDTALIHKVLPRQSVIARQAVGKFGEKQIIASNIDYAFLVQAVDRDFNLNRLERYLSICYSSNISPIAILTKTDLIDISRQKELIENIKSRISNLPVYAISNLSQDGYEPLKKVIEEGKTYCLLGSSGVGKSSLINTLSGIPLMKTNSISESTQKGRHVTTHRELMVLDNGGILIDNPGMREIGVIDTEQGSGTVFDSIAAYAQNCKFKDCTHTSETGCSVLDALKNGQLDAAAYENYLKIEKEKAFFETNSTERKRRDKMFGKIARDYYRKDVKGKKY